MQDNNYNEKNSFLYSFIFRVVENAKKEFDKGQEPLISLEVADKKAEGTLKVRTPDGNFPVSFAEGIMTLGVSTYGNQFRSSGKNGLSHMVLIVTWDVFVTIINGMQERAKEIKLVVFSSQNAKQGEFDKIASITATVGTSHAYSFFHDGTKYVAFLVTSDKPVAIAANSSKADGQGSGGNVATTTGAKFEQK